MLSEKHNGASASAPADQGHRLMFLEEIAGVPLRTGRFGHKVARVLERKWDPDYLRFCYERWREFGYNVHNYGWVIDWYDHDAAPLREGEVAPHALPVPEHPAAEWQLTGEGEIVTDADLPVLAPLRSAKSARGEPDLKPIPGSQQRAFTSHYPDEGTRLDKAHRIKFNVRVGGAPPPKAPLGSLYADIPEILFQLPLSQSEQVLPAHAPMRATEWAEFPCNDRWEAERAVISARNYGRKWGFDNHWFIQAERRGSSCWARRVCAPDELDLWDLFNARKEERANGRD